MKAFFTCPAELYGVIPGPIPARLVLPDWFKRLPAFGVDGLITSKRCMPLLDALSIGYIIPLAFTVELDVSDDGATVAANRQGVVTQHFPSQVDGHHHLPRAPAKWLNQWRLRTAPGWSTLFVPPLNRASPFECVAGVVDTDRFIAKPVNFPFFWTAPDGRHVIEAGTPLVQAIPFMRDELDVEIRAETRDEERAAAKQEELFAQTGAYRQHIRSNNR